MPIAASQGTPPPKRQTARKPAAKTVPAVTQTEARYEGLMGLGQIASAICIMRGLYADAGAIGLHYPNVARETANLASQNETIGKAIDYLNSAGPYAGLLTASLPLALQLLANHDRIDATKITGMDVMPPEALEAKVRADMDTRATEIMAEAQRAQQEAQKSREALADSMRDQAESVA
jgi:hypothetical protein